MSLLVEPRIWQQAQQCIRTGVSESSRTPGRYLLPRVRCAHFTQHNGQLLALHGLTKGTWRRYRLMQYSNNRKVEVTPVDDLAHRFPRSFDADELEAAVLTVFMSPPDSDGEAVLSWRLVVTAPH